MLKAIYKIENLINHKIYIGQTVNPYSRWHKHISESRKENLSYRSHLYNAMKKYGIEYFHYEILEDNITDKNELSEKEKYWIQKLNTIRPNSYNIASGGEGGNGTHAKNLQRWRKDNPDKVKININKLLQWRKEHPKEMQLIKEKIHQWRKEHPENTKAANEATKKKVRCIETGIVYESASAASKAVGGKTSAHIGQVCNGKRKTAYRYHWEWAERTED